MNKSEITAQNRGKRELVNVLITGFLLAIIGFTMAFLLFWFLGAFGPNQTPLDSLNQYLEREREDKACNAIRYSATVNNYSSSEMICAISKCLCQFKTVLTESGLILPLLYILIALLLYAVSLKVGAKIRMRFWAKSFFIGAIIAALLPGLVFWLVRLLV